MSFPFSFWQQNPLSYPGLVQWYDANYVHDANQDANDRSGNGNTGLNSNVTIVPGVVSGLPVFRFNGTSSKLIYTPIVAGTSFSAFAFVKSPSSGAAASFIGWIRPDALNQLLVATTGPKMGCDDGTTQVLSNVSDWYDNFALMGVVCNAGLCTFYQNGSAIGSPVGVITGLTVTDFGGSTSFFSAFDCTELVLYNTALGTAQVSGLTQYFRGKSQF